MDSTTTSTTSRQQRSSPASNDRDHTPSQHQQHLQHQQVPYGFQQQPQGQWAPSISAQPFYPSFYQNHQQSSPAGFPQQTPPYFDPAANPQLAQWAYQQMMFNAQQGFLPPGSSRNSPSSSNPNDYFAQSQMGVGPGSHGMFNPFPSGTPPPPQHQQNGGGQQQPYPGFHPYRRPARQGSSTSQGTHSFPESGGSGNNDWRPPYARPEASGSSSSVNSTHSQRQRTDSNQSARGSQHGSQHGHGSANGSVRGRPSGGGGSPVGGGSSNKHSQSPSHSHTRPQQSQQHRSHSPSHSSNASKNLPHPSPPHHRNLSASSNTSSSSVVRSSSATAGTPSQSPPAPSPSSSSAPGSAPSTSPSSPSSSTTSHSSNPSISTTASTVPRPARPSPLSQGTTSFHASSERRMSRDDADLAAMMREEAASDRHKSGIKGRLRRALTFGTINSPGINEEGEDDDNESIKASKLAKSKPSPLARPSTDSVLSEESNNTIQTTNTALKASPSNISATSTSTSPGPPPAQKKRGRAASLFNSRLNASTDNISLSSTVSSASVMIRKLGSMGRLARRNSLAGITSLFKDKKKKEEDAPAEDDDTAPSSSDAGGKDDKKKKKKKDKEKEKEKKGATAKAMVSEASVSHVTAELDRGSGPEWNAAELAGLSPAAKLARQHTLKSNAEAAAKERERLQQEKEALEREAAAAAAAAKVNGVNGAGGVPAWERGTHNRSPVKGGGNVRVNEDGTRVVVEDDDEEDWSEDGHRPGQQRQQAYQPGGPEGWDDDGDDDDWDGEEEEDVTIRMGVDRVDLNNPTAGRAAGDWGEGDDMEEWATGLRRSEERTKKPSKGILKFAIDYDQHNYLVDSSHPQPRVRSNSYNEHPSQQNELGPLARIPSPDPDHIDGLHRHGSHSSGGHGAPQPASAGGASAPFLPPLSFDSSPIKANMDSPQKPPASSAPLFSHPNSSAPALSLSVTSNPPTLTHRSATAPSKRLAFANNLSVYDTFSSSVYDRRSEPATWSRLTPALAQRIKEELNSYKMEEMEVHAASRIHTQFFV
ncbi:hypothetical protein V5O48_005091 [Marasmius crinis-equi]|uniref:Uncharacterized protein n=1 Tax=Marasmius crinis-equi TaxID=585013 RepID=A0ABR3FNZ7_9AGAR